MSARDMVARRQSKDDGDFVPTPGYATRALFECVLPPELKNPKTPTTLWDPACGQGHMCRVFEEYGYKSYGSDVEDWSEGKYLKQNFLGWDDLLTPEGSFGIITNPPYNRLNEFLLQAIALKPFMIAMLVRVQALESQKRYKWVYENNPPSILGFFADRIPFKYGSVQPQASKMFFHTWMVWCPSLGYNHTRAVWIPSNAQQMLEKREDYDAP